MKVLTAGKRVRRRRHGVRRADGEQVRHLRVRAAARSARRAVRGLLRKNKAACGVLFDAQPAGLPQGHRLVDRQREAGRDAPGALLKILDRRARERKAAAMTSYVALLRGVNVGGNKMVAMAELRADARRRRLQDRGRRCCRAATRRSAAARMKSPAKREALLEAETAKRLRPDVSTTTCVPPAELQAAIDANPLKAAGEAGSQPSARQLLQGAARHGEGQGRTGRDRRVPRSFAATAVTSTCSYPAGQGKLEGPAPSSTGSSACAAPGAAGTP